MESTTGAAPAVEACALALGDGRWLAAPPSGNGALTACFGVLPVDGVLFLQRLSPERCVLYSGSGLAVHVHEDGSLTTRPAASPTSTQLELRPHDGGHALRAEANDLWVTADPAGRVTAASMQPGRVLLCLAPVPGMVTASWALAHLHNTHVALLTARAAGAGVSGWVTAHPPRLPSPPSGVLAGLGGLLAALPGAAGVTAAVSLLAGGSAVTTRTTHLMFWELWRLYVCDAAARSVALESVNHKLWLCPAPDGRVTASAAEVGCWERLTLEDAGGGAVALRTCHGGAGARYLSALAEDGRMDANAPNFPTSDEHFYLLDAEAARAHYWNVGVAGCIAALQQPHALLAQRSS